jgi:type IX secretion system PorP/SprF family membrane protein
MLHYLDRHITTKIVAICIIVIFGFNDLKAQDPQFSQFYATSLYLGPSLAGSTDGSRVTLNYRNQWPFIANGFQSYMMSVDHFFSRINSGVGIMAMRETAGSGNLSSTYIGGAYSYHVKLNRNWSMRPGLMMNYLQRNIDFSSLIFTDQIINGGGSPSVSLNTSKVWKLDFASSVIFFNRSIWFGATVKHLSKPNVSFMGDDMRLGRNYSIYAGSRLELRKISSTFPRGQYLYPNIQFKWQDTYKQLDLGAYWEINPLLFGLRYRGIPVFKKLPNSDAVIFLAGFRQERMTFSYSYDLTISRLLGSGGGGAHEIVLIYNFNQELKIKRKPMPCPHCHYD